MLFDTHAHYDDERFDEDRDALLSAMTENGVGLILNPGCDLESSRKAVGYAQKYPFIYAAVGIHPENIDENWNNDLAVIKELAQTEPKVRAIGEIGLDYYWEKDERARARQQVVFARQMELARALGKPVIVHDRDAHGDCMEIARQYAGVTGVYPLLRGQRGDGARAAQAGILSVIHRCDHVQKRAQGIGDYQGDTARPADD